MLHLSVARRRFGQVIGRFKNGSVKENTQFRDFEAS